MGSLPYAFSVHHFINSVGADAGFAAIIGLAILVLLYFAQARETSALRDQAQEWAQRVQQLEARLAHISRGQAAAEARPPAPAPTAGRPAANRVGATSPVTPAVAQASAPAYVAAPPPVPAHAAASTQVTAPPPVPAHAVASAQVTAPSPVPANAAARAEATVQSAAAGGGTLPPPRPHGPPPGAPAGVAAPALTAATKLIPSSPSARPSETAASPTAADRQTDGGAVASPAAAPTTAGGNGAAAGRVPQPASYAGGRAAATAGTQPPPRAQVRRPPLGARPAAPLAGLGADAGPSPRLSPLLTILIGGLMIGVIVVGLLVITSISNNSKTSTSARTVNGNGQHQAASTAVVSPSSVTVAVLNGTATSGLAAHVSQRLVGDGYRKATVGNAADQTHTSTVVAYRTGDERAALAVAKSLGLSEASVQQVDQGTLQIACPPPSPCTVGVVVTVGTDLGSRA